MSIDGNRRVLSGMRPTGRLHLGHYHGVLKNWVELQHEYQCFFFVADWHALTTGYEIRQELLILRSILSSIGYRLELTLVKRQFLFSRVSPNTQNFIYFCL